MSTAAHSTARASIHGTLTQRAGGAADAGAVVEAITSTWQSMAVQLEPVIGVRGVLVLLARALHLTGKTYPWLAQAGPLQEGDDPLAGLRARFAHRNAQDATEAGGILLVHFNELLVSLIGMPLTEQLLASVWTDTSVPAGQDDTGANP